MKATLKSLDLSSSVGFSEFRPEDPARFGFWASASIGVTNTVGSDLFQVFFCNRDWLAHEGMSRTERYIELQEPYDPEEARSQLVARIDSCNGKSWPELVAQLSQFCEWEFEDYRDE